MTRRLQNPLPQYIRDLQWRAADPGASVWVTANAGSGKTHVLTQRVLRLLLSGVAPDSILCLTYTKAAAAEMRRRVARDLGRWAVIDDSALDAALTDLCGTPPSGADQRRARTLFARALETPGGLKIVTIHAFCESVLHRFPLEAGVPFDFVVLEEHERDALVLRAREAVLAGGLNGDPAIAAAVESLFELLSDGQLTEAIESALQQARKLRPVLRRPDLAKAELLTLVGRGRARTAIETAITAERIVGPAEIATLLAALPAGAFRDKLAAMNPDAPLPGSVLGTFLTQSLKKPKSGYPPAQLRKLYPALADLLDREADRLEALADELRRAELVERSDALLDVLGAIAARYEADKRERSLLDFDDLIESAVRLFENEAIGPWVQFKLDAGIDHILVDESQDTNPEQWKAVKALAAEFFVGRSAVERPRTLFAVGDVKQSIFSFQGAEPRVFLSSGREFEARASQVALTFTAIPLRTSFRTLPGILKAVDIVFDSDAMRTAVLADGPVLHETARGEQGGMVTLWPPIRDVDDTADQDAWPLTLNTRFQSAARQVAERIAGEIKSWIDTSRPLGPRGRPVRADDVLILVQIRGALFRELIRALHREGLPTPGADRLDVTSHIGVLDLMALGDVMLNPGDSLQLAALLRSPLFDLSEDDLYEVAAKRPDGVTLWGALKSSTLLGPNAAYGELSTWRSRLDFERPFEFYASILYGAGGLKRFHARFGREVDDVFAEFLDLALEHEQNAQPSLQGFLAAMRSRDVEIRRELSGTGGVRVMTVHGAKGLEAPIVILADAASKPAGRQVLNPVHIVAEPPMLIHASKAESHVPETDRFRVAYVAAQKEEYWRKLYVGMTRAEDELYITGTLTKNGKPEGTWYEAVENALRPYAEIATDAEGGATALIYPQVRPSPEPLTASVAGDDATTPLAPLPPLPVHPRIETLRPSSAFTPADPERALETLNERAADPALARERGIAVHLLLQYLGNIPPADRPAVAARALAQRFPDLVEIHAEIAAKAISILTRPDLADLFGPDSRAEIPFLANARRNGTPIHLAGRIDRLVVTPERVLVVDYKSDAVEPSSAAAVNESYATQLGLYALCAGELFPGRDIEAAILWTGPESLMKLPMDRLMTAIEGFTMR